MHKLTDTSISSPFRRHRYRPCQMAERNERVLVATERHPATRVPVANALLCVPRLSQHGAACAALRRS